MQGTITQHVQSNPSSLAQKAVLVPLKAIGDRASSQLINSGGLRIKGGRASAIVQAHTALLASAQGKLVTKAADTDMAALVGTIVTTAFNVYVFYIDVAGNLTTAMGIAGSTLANVVFPPTPEGKAMIGFVIINPTGAGSFVGGTTVLDDAGVVPNAVFANTTSGLDPTIIIS